jgi:hypothetical protein
MILDTTGGLFPEGQYVFRIESMPETGKYPSGHQYVQFKFETEIDGESQTYSERFVVWLMGPLCQALGFKEVKPGHYDFQEAACMGRSIVGTIVHEKIEKGKRVGETVARMKDIKPVDAAATAKAAGPADDDTFGSTPRKKEANKGEGIPF